MASKYLQKFPVPKGFPEILHDFSREILREQPGDIIKFAVAYFKAMEEGKPLVWEDPHPRAPKPSDYPKVKGEIIQSYRAEKPAVLSVQSRPNLSGSSNREEISRPMSQVSVKSSSSAASEAAREYLSEVLEKIFDRLIESQ